MRGDAGKMKGARLSEVGGIRIAAECSVARRCDGSAGGGRSSGNVLQNKERNKEC